MDWTDDTIARLRTFWDEGHSTAEIGRRLGITKNAVVGKAHRLNLSARPSPIRRTLGEGKATPRVTHRRASGSTLPALAATAPISRPQELPRSLPALRAVQVTPRPAGRITACCWPIGEPGTASFCFCSDSAIAGKPYCADHAAVAYVKVRDRREEAA